MAFNGNEGEEITLAEGAAYTLRYRSDNPEEVKGVFFGRDHIEKLLGQDDCAGLRMYFAKNADGSPTLVVVGADSNQDDILEKIYQRLVPCPDKCGGSNPLNSNPKPQEQK